MAVPVWVPGQVLVASDVNNWLAPNGLLKPSAQSVTSSTTLVNDTALVLPLTANAQYIFRAMFAYTGAALGTADMKFQWTLPAAATMVFALEGIGTAGGSFVGNAFTQASLIAIGTQGATNCGALLYGSVTVGANTGNLQLQWAQNSSNVTSTTMQAGSSLELMRVS